MSRGRKVHPDQLELPAMIVKITGSGREPRRTEECLLWRRVWWERDPEALAKIVDLNRRLVQKLAHDKTRGLGIEAVEDLEGHLLERMPDLLRRWNPAKGSLGMWIGYKLANESRSWSRTALRHKARQDRAVEAMKPNLERSRERRTDAGSIQASAEFSEAIQAIRRNMAAADWPDEEWTTGVLLLCEITSPQEVGRWLGVRPRKAAAILQRVRERLAEIPELAGLAGDG